MADDDSQARPLSPWLMGPLEGFVSALVGLVIVAVVSRAGTAVERHNKGFLNSCAVNSTVAPIVSKSSETNNQLFLHDSCALCASFLRSTCLLCCDVTGPRLGPGPSETTGLPAFCEERLLREGVSKDTNTLRKGWERELKEGYFNDLRRL
ncbi:hypothetical protein VTI74DRAFT_10719 [Chaetomium olivicolor]